jgi:hypothetical protein
MADDRPPNTPALPCPFWCQIDHAEHASGISHQGVRRAGSDIEVALYLTDYGTDAPELASLNGYEDSAAYPLMLAGFRHPLAVARSYLGETP